MKFWRVGYYRELFIFWFLYNLRPPYIAPAAINKEIPPSIGTQGGGQQSNEPPDGGGGGKATHKDVKPIMKSRDNKNFVLIVVKY